MGKGYNNFMSKKGFHPGSQANQKKVHEAEARAAAKRKHDDETLAQYLAEQELFQQKSLVSKLSKEKLSLNFMYEAPPGVEKPDQKQNDKVEFRGSDGSKVSMAGSSTGSGHKGEPEICLEWKRSKPVARKSAQDVRGGGKETVIKKEHEIKSEHDSKQKSDDLKIKRNTTSEEECKPDIKQEPIKKRVKCER